MKIQIVDLEFVPLITYSEIEKRIAVIAEQLAARYSDKTPIFVGVLNGSFMFMADLLKAVNFPCEVAFTKISSYHGGLTSSRVITDDVDLSIDITGRHIILVEDIVDTGGTLNYLLTKLALRNAASITICALLLKPAALEFKLEALKYVAFEIENKFVVGYGLDYKELGRNLKDIYQLVI